VATFVIEKYRNFMGFFNSFSPFFLYCPEDQSVNQSVVQIVLTVCQCFALVLLLLRISLKIIEQAFTQNLLTSRDFLFGSSNAVDTKKRIIVMVKYIL